MFNQLMEEQKNLKTAVISDEISQDIDEVVKLTLKHKFDAVEIRSVWGKAPLDLDRSDCQRIVAKLQSAGLTVAAFASPAFKVDLPTSVTQRAAARSTLELSIIRAQWLNAPLLRIFSFLRRESPNPAAAAQVIGEILHDIGEPPIELLVETGTRTNTPNASTMCRLLSELKSSYLGVLWDPGNGVFSGLEHVPYPEPYQLISKHIRHVHVKDPLGTKYYTKLGQGSVPWHTILDKLQTDGFLGYVSLETHWRRNRVLTPEERDRPWGYRFSIGGYETSDECMAVLSTMIASTTP